MRFNRRRFLTGSLAATASAAVPMLVARRAWGANETIRVGVIGLGGRGRGAHLPSFQQQPQVEVVAVCDPDRSRLDSAAQMIQDKYGHTPERYTDMRALLDRKDIDVVGNATQNYWHGLSTIWACQAGKHVYVEKPLSHYIWEGRQMVRAARHYDRIVQCGTQRRSQTSIAQAIEWIREGHLGKIQFVTAFANKARSSCGKRTEPLPIPETIDYELWCGPAQKLPIYRDRLQYDCSFDWNTGDGESCNQGVHEMDAARWCLGEHQLPRRVLSIGGRFVFNDACNTPNTQIIYYDFPTAPVLYEVHNLPKEKGSREMPTYDGERVGVVVTCEGGRVSLYRGIAWDEQGEIVQRFSGNSDHFVNFIEAVRTGDRGHLKADVEEGHLSTAVCHTGNISYRLGQPASLADQRNAVSVDERFAKMHERFLDHLKAHDIDPETAVLGRWATVDREHEQVLDDPQANQLVRGSYREPFRIPEIPS